MISSKSWNCWILYSVLLVSRISCEKEKTTVSSEMTRPQSKASAATVSPNVTFCRFPKSRDTCYYYYDVHLTLNEAGVFCHGLGMNVFHFDNDNTTALFVREKLRNIPGGIWLGAIKLSNGWSWISGLKFTDAWTNNIISTNGDQRNDACLILVTSIHSFASVNCQNKFSVLCQASTTTAVSTAHPLETDTLSMEITPMLEFPISNANNESDITKTSSTQLESNVSKAATLRERTTSEPSTVKHDGFNFSTPLIKSFQTVHSTKTSSIVAGATIKQINETAIYTASFCIPAPGGEMCYYYFEDRRNQLDAAALCNGFGKEIFHFDNNIATTQYVREHLKNISGGIWLGAIKLTNGWIWLDGQKFTDFWIGKILSTDPNSENKSCLILVPSIEPLARMGCQESYSVLCQDKNGTIRNQTTRKETTVAITMVPSVVTSVRLSSSTHSRQSVVTFLTQKTTTVASEITSHQSKANVATMSPNVTFCKSAMSTSRDTCYYYYDLRLNLNETIAFCRGLGMNVFQFDNDNPTSQFVRENLRSIPGGIWLGATKLSNGWNWISGQKFTDVLTANIISTDPNSENKSCLILVPSIERLARMGCQDSYSVLCQGEHVRRPLSSSNESANVLVTTSPTDKSSVSPFKTSPRTGTSMSNANNASDFVSRLSVNLTNTKATTSMAWTHFKSKIPTSSSSSSSSKTTVTPTKGNKSMTPPQLVVTTTNMVTMTPDSMTFPSVANELSTTVSTNTILQYVSNEQSNTVNRSKLLEKFTTTVVNGETNLAPITLKNPGTPKMSTSEGNIPLSTQQTNSHVKQPVSLPASSSRTPLHGGTTQSILSRPIAYLSTKHEYSFSSTEPDRRFRSQQTTMFIRQSTRMSSAVPTSKHTANTKGLPSDRMEQTSQLPSDGFNSVVRGNTSNIQDISARTLSFTSSFIKDSILPVSTPSYYDSATTTDRIVMSQSNIAVSSQHYASKALIVGASVGVGVLLLFIILAVLIRKRMGNGKESKRQNDQPLNVCQSNGDNADGYITEFNARFVENPLYGQTEL